MNTQDFDIAPYVDRLVASYEFVSDVVMSKHGQAIVVAIRSGDASAMPALIRDTAERLLYDTLSGEPCQDWLAESLCQLYEKYDGDIIS